MDIFVARLRNRTLKKILPSLLLVILLANIFGYQLILELDRSLVRKTMRDLIEAGTDRYTIIRVPAVSGNPDLRRLDEKEIEYQGHMYDVIREFCDGSSIVFHCVRDIREENLARASARNSQKNLFSFLFQHLITQAMPAAARIETPGISTAISYPPVVSNHSSAYRLTHSPPPKA